LTLNGITPYYCSMDNKRKRVVVTGGLGFIGQNLVPILAKEGYFPLVIDFLDPSGIGKITGKWNLIHGIDYRVVTEDIRNIETVANLLEQEGPAAIIHLAAKHFIPDCNANPLETVSINVDGTMGLLNIAKRVGIKKFIFTSSAAVYKSSNQRHKESDALEPIDIYGMSKVAGEWLIRSHSMAREQEGVEFVVLRLFNVYGPSDNTPHFIPQIVRQVKAANIVCHGNLETIRDYVYIGDVVNAIIRALKKNLPGYTRLNVGSGKGSSGKEIIDLIAKLTNKNLLLKKDPGLSRATDRNRLIADTHLITSILGWEAKYLIQDGLKQLLTQ